jgi:thiosulfate/3-mercaptopyruvate sulfurtransferase
MPQLMGHFLQTSDEGTPYFKIEPAEMAFYIGKNVEPTDQRPWSYVVLRHVPIDRESFSFYGNNLSPEFDARPTFAHATPHNIQRNTPQNASCDSCHGNESLFLTADKVLPDELAANQEVIVDELP